MRPRFLIVARGEECDWPALIEATEKLIPIELSFSNSRIAAFASRGCRCLHLNEAGCVVGTLFHRHGPASAVEFLEKAEAESIVESGGDRLLSRFWGSYVAAVAGPDCATILRDPSATLPCYFADGRGFTLLASDAGLLLGALALDAEIDWTAIAQDLFRAGLPAPATSLRGVRELLAGFSIRVPGGQEQCQRWSPWDHVDQTVDPAEAPERLARIVEHCVRSLAAGRGRLLLSVSGGLDSSIVAACLAGGGSELTCLTMFDEQDPSGDERDFARLLCKDLGLSLIERPYRLEQIDVADALGTHLPRSRDRTHAIAYEHAHREAAGAIGADAFVTGNGGDSVFGYSQSAAPIADSFLAGRRWREIASTTFDVCRQTGCSLFDAAAHAIRVARGPRAYICRPNPLLLHRQVVDVLSESPLRHPWLVAPERALPGTAAHIASILRVQQSLEPDRGRYCAVLNPLMSQPIVEACLAIPSWEWRRDGLDRSVARRGFEGRLPRAILRRHVKGGPSQFASRVLDHFRSSIRDRLLSGRLAGHGIIDASALEAALEDGRACSDDERVRILELVATEAWIDRWLERSSDRDDRRKPDFSLSPLARSAS